MLRKGLENRSNLVIQPVKRSEGGTGIRDSRPGINLEKTSSISKWLNLYIDRVKRLIAYCTRSRSADAVLPVSRGEEAKHSKVKELRSAAHLD